MNPNLASVQTIQLYDISGKRIYESKKLDVSESYSISTEALSEGVYILNLTTSDNLKFSQKVIISKLKS
ncbi:T9SS type A sorting domain-containing protein [Flavobacterium macacae]|uniref:T9SS type A sorting domain-containing protein n=1 Tax=Flavobacterium macacae TaxID=2488993 RepID=UPI001F24F15D|nr:T9SS type A sorting domain-containing protein [Flavobacterium macacae]